MKYITLFFVVVGLLLTAPLVSAGEDVVITSGTEYKGDIKIEAANVKIESGGMVTGNIFIEEGDLFIEQSGGKVTGNIFIEEGDLFIEQSGVVNGGGAVTIKKGNIFIKNNVTVAGSLNVTIGNATLKDKNSIDGDIICRNGVVTLGAHNVVTGNVYAKDLVAGTTTIIKGKFVKTP